MRALRLLYVSPLKALNYDIERNLRSPLAGLGSTLAVGVRTGDTPADERRRMLSTPPDILITTPESLFLLLTSQARETLRGIETVILDEVHAVAGTKRGAHLAVCLERLERLVDAPYQRVGLSATQRPLEEIGRFVAGSGREIELIDAGVRKELDLEVVVPVEDMREPGQVSVDAGEPPGSPRPFHWSARADRRLRRRHGTVQPLDLALDLSRDPRPRPRSPVHDRVREQPTSRRTSRLCASTSWRKRSSLERITARWHASSGSSSRSC